MEWCCSKVNKSHCRITKSLCFQDFAFVFPFVKPNLFNLTQNVLCGFIQIITMCVEESHY
jgi:hypothetical protein